MLDIQDLVSNNYYSKAEIENYGIKELHSIHYFNKESDHEGQLSCTKQEATQLKRNAIKLIKACNDIIDHKESVTESS